MLPFRNAHCLLRKHLVQLGCFLSLILIAKCAKELTANISRFLLMEVTDMNWDWNWGKDYGCLDPEAHYSIWILCVSHAPFSFLPSHTPVTAAGRRLPSWEAPMILFLCRQGISWKTDSYVPPCFKSLAWPGVLHSSPGNIWPVLYWGDAERDLAAIDLTEMDECVHIADLKKTTLHQVNAMLSTCFWKLWSRIIWKIKKCRDLTPASN